jgi:pimeloyl-ACP methyl ester carboxylesterase
VPLARSTALTAMTGLLVAAGATPASAAPELEWRLCSDIARGWDEDDDRTLCASVPVPLDHDDPDGRSIEIAVTRVPAAEESTYPILFNPGGPGRQGVTMPLHILESSAADLGRDHDLIGFDARGVGYSGALECDYEMTPPEPGLDAEDRDRHVAEEQGRMNSACHAHDPAMVASLTVENVARDMELVREALGEETIGYYGVSWGTLLGATYRSHHDDRVEAMLLDSVVSPDSSLTRLEEGQLEAGEAVFHRFTAWMADHHDVYGHGSDASRLRGDLLALRDELAEDPRIGPDGSVADGDAVTMLLATPEREWPDNARALGTMLDGGVPELWTPHGRTVGTGWDAETDGATPFAQIALFCNDSDSPRDFEEVWHNRTERAERFPAMGGLGFYEHLCVGWPEEGASPDLGPGQSPLQLVGHSKEMVTPHEWAKDMRDVIGGEVMTVDDDGHGTLSDLDCASAAVDFFATGRSTADTCPGPPPPTPEG